MKAAQGLIEDLIAKNSFPPLPEPHIDAESVINLKNLGCRVSLLTIQNDPDFQLPKSLQDVFETVMIGPAYDFFGGGNEQSKIRLYRQHYPEKGPLVYVGDQTYEAKVAQGIGATYFFQVTGDLPTHYVKKKIPEDTATVKTLADFVGQFGQFGQSIVNPGQGGDLGKA
ncbi:MAG: hypothetical protein ACKO43_01420 [Alphaproteobacteria bacterium]